MQTNSRPLVKLRISCYITFLAAIIATLLGVMGQGLAASSGGGNGGISGQLLAIKDFLCIYSAIVAVYLLISSLIYPQQNASYLKTLIPSLFDVIILFIVFLNFA